MAPLPIRPLLVDDLPAMKSHIDRHAAESGRDGDYHFMPFAPGGTSGPTLPGPAPLLRGLDEPGWQRWFVAVAPDDAFVGHVDLKGDGLRTGMHRCMLGIGIERPFRGSGLGSRLMATAIAFAREAEQLDWIDLCVFGQNKPALALYAAIGFEQVGAIEDRFRIDDDIIDDILMTLNTVSYTTP